MKIILPLYLLFGALSYYFMVLKTCERHKVKTGAYHILMTLMFWPLPWIAILFKFIRKNVKR